MSNEVGLRLKELRRKLNMSQAQLGEKMGIKATTLAKHESGICFPTGKMRNILASQYNVSMDYLLCGRGKLFYENKDNSDSNRLKNIIKGDKELEELFSLVSSMSWVRHAVLSYFQRFKLENRELIQNEIVHVISKLQSTDLFRKDQKHKSRLKYLVLKKCSRGRVDFLSQGMVNNNLPITLEMYRRREADSALLKGTEVKLHPLKAGA